METQTIVRPHATEGNTKLNTCLSCFYHWEKTQPDKVYLKQPAGTAWIDYTWREVGQQARKMAAALQAMDLPAHSHIGIVSKNCAHWIICDLAIMMSGHVSIPFYANLTADQLHQLLTHSNCQVLFVGKLEQWAVMRTGVPASITCIALPGSPATEVLSWEEVIAAHPPITENPLPDPRELFSIIYTSGTTGRPKGVMVTWFANASSIAHTTPELSLERNDCRFFSYLPLCHIAERAVVEMFSLYSGGTVFFAESLESFTRHLRDAQPTHFIAVPRIWTKFQLGILEKVPARKLDWLLRLPLVGGTVKKKIQKALGLDAARLILTGAAPMSVTLLQWYQRLGIFIQEAYGMSENMGACNLMRREGCKVGTVGKPYPGVELKIEQGSNEVLMKADWLMKGYYREPELTAQVLRDSYLCTGDRGEIDSEGYLRLLGRVKDIFKSSKGEYIVPSTIEFGFAANAWVEQVCVVGSGLPHPIALVVPSAVSQQTDKIVFAASLASTTEAVNRTLQDYERVKKVVVVQEPWNVENDLLTPTMKIKRHLIETKYQQQFESWYARPSLVVWEQNQ